MKEQNLNIGAPGLRVIVGAKQGAVNCVERCANASKCNLVAFAGAIWGLDAKEGTVQVVFDRACEGGKHLVSVDSTSLEFAGYKIIFSFHDTNDIVKCDSTGCTFSCHYVVYNFLVPTKFNVCPTHCIEWFNKEYRVLADVVDQQKKQFNLLKYSEPYKLPINLKGSF